VVPQRAVQDLQGKNYVWIVDATGHAQQRDVRLGPRIGSDWQVQQGLKAGDVVIVDGVSTSEARKFGQSRAFSGRNPERGMIDYSSIIRSSRRYWAIIITIAGAVSLSGLPVAALSADYPADDRGIDELPRRRCRHNRAIDRRADRAAGQRRAAHDLHGFPKRQ